jgi:energy-coupling factor transporter ATP-binding protein EcfA2
MKTNKGLIITGPAPSGKSMLAKWIEQLHGKENTVWFEGRDEHLIHRISLHMADHPEGALVIVDDLVDVSKVLELANIPTGGIRVNPRGRNPFDIPADKIKLIITIPHRLNRAPQLTTHSIQRRFDIIDTVGCGHMMIQKPKLTD